MRSGKHISSTVLTLLFSTVVLGVYSSNTSVKADQIGKSVETNIKAPASSSAKEESVASTNKSVDINNQDVANDETFKETNTATAELNKDTTAQGKTEEKTNEALLEQDSKQGNTTDGSSAEVAESSNKPEKTETSETSQETSVKEESNSKQSAVTSETKTSETDVQQDTTVKNQQIGKNIDSQANEAGISLGYNDDGQTIFSDAAGHQLKNQFVSYDGATYYVNENGIAVTDNWFTQDGKNTILIIVVRCLQKVFNV